MLSNPSIGFGLTTSSNVMEAMKSRPGLSPQSSTTQETPYSGITDPTAFSDWYNKQTKEEAEAQRAWSKEQAQEQMEFQERMSNTAYQRAVEDMKKAGLNPYMLMAGSASGSSTPAGAMATTSQRDIYQTNDSLKRDEALLEFASSLISSATKLFKLF